MKPAARSIWKQGFMWIPAAKTLTPSRPRSLRVWACVGAQRSSEMKLMGKFITGIFSLLLIAAAWAGTKEAPGQTVDSGSFAILVNGQRVATEKFNIQQAATGSTINSELREDASTEKASQTSSMHLTAAGELIRYEWRELNPGKTQLELVPNDQFLLERVTVNPGEKPIEQPFLLPSSTVVLDNNFFVHRELLVWRYLAQNCKADPGQPLRCTSCPTSFGAVVRQVRLFI